MPRTYTQTDTAADSGASAGCSGATLAGTADAVEIVEGGTAGSIETTFDLGSLATEAIAMFQTDVGTGEPPETDWPSGDYVVRANITTAQNNITWEETWICERTSGGTFNEVASLTAQGQDVSAGGVFTQTVNRATDYTPADADSTLYIVLVFANSNQHTSRTVGITPDQDIDTPIGAAVTTLTAESGSVPISGTAATLLVASLLTAAAGSVPITGTDAALTKSFQLTAESGSVSITGTDATLSTAGVDPAGTDGLWGAVSWGETSWGEDAVAGVTTLTAESGSIPITGTAASLLYDRILSAEAGSVPITGTAATLTKSLLLSAESGAVPITGTDASLVEASLLSAESGAIPITGSAASLIHDQILSAESGAIPITGTAATLSQTITLTAEAGSIPISGTAASLVRALSLSAEAGAVPITGTAATLSADVTLSAESGAVPITGSVATLSVPGQPLEAPYGTLSITVGGNAVDWYTGRDVPQPRKNERYGAVRTMTFYTLDTGIAFLDEVSVTMDWAQTPGGATVTSETWFAGRVTAPPKWERSGDNDELVCRVDVACPIWELMRSGSFTRSWSPTAVQTVVAAIASNYASGFTTDLASGATITPSFTDADPWDMLKSAAMQAGMLLDITYDKVIRLYDQGDKTYGLDFDRTSTSPTFGFGQFSHEEHGELYANRIRVVGSDDNVVTRNNTTEQTATGLVVEARPFVASGVTDTATLNRIGDLILDRRANRSPLPLSGDFVTLRNGLVPGQEATINYPSLGITALAAYVDSVDWSHMGGGRWQQRVRWTDSLLDFAAAVSERRAALESWQAAQEAQQIDPDAEPEPKVHHRGFVDQPDVSEPAPASDEVFVHVRWNETNGQARLVLRTGKTTDVNIGFRIVLSAKSAITVTRTLESTEAGEDVAITGSGTRKVVIVSQKSGVNDSWTINNDLDRLRLNLSGDYNGVDAEITLRGLGGFETIDRITFGNDVLASNIPSGKPFKFKVRLDALVTSGGVAENKIGKQVADGDSYGDLYDDSSKTTKLTDNPNRRRTQNFDEYDGTNTRTPAQQIDRADRADGVLNTGGTGMKDGKTLGTGGLQTRNDGVGTGSVQTLDGTGRVRGDDYDGVNQRTRTQMIDGRDRSVTGLNSSGFVSQNIRASDGTTNLIEIASADPLFQNGTMRSSCDFGERPDGSRALGSGNSRAGSARGLQYNESDGRMYGKLTGGTTIWRTGGNDFPIGGGGSDGAAITRNDGGTTGGGDSGDNPGGGGVLDA